MKHIYKDLFFDLDGTLWDLHGNSHKTLSELWPRFNLNKDNHLDFDHFYRRYRHHNERVWALYRDGKIEKKNLRIERFERAFADIGLNFESWMQEFADSFMDLCPRQPGLIEGALEVLDHVSKKYRLHIITNGFSEVQGIKMQSSGLDGRFTEIINSEDCGIRKPHRGIFTHALERSGASVESSLMIGDDWDADILGARDFGMHQAWLRSDQSRHNFTPTYTLESLRDLLHIL
ncbi:MAG: YjjG family noncanonical pyrimidine nucleotidase [Flavobacteriales bacterium]|nr:YjjG family noncanonical pyrimidine nucleotidase [Flavobacteriales bacterium]